MSVFVVVRIAASAEQVRLAEAREPGLYDEITSLAQRHGLISHRRLYRADGIMDIDEWPSEEARNRFRVEAAALVERMRTARGSAPSTAETWFDSPDDAG